LRTGAAGITATTLALSGVQANGANIQITLDASAIGYADTLPVTAATELRADSDYEGLAKRFHVFSPSYARQSGNGKIATVRALKMLAALDLALDDAGASIHLSKPPPFMTINLSVSAQELPGIGAAFRGAKITVRLRGRLQRPSADALRRRLREIGWHATSSDSEEKRNDAPLRDSQ